MASFGRGRRPDGIFIQVLDWMLASLVVLWPATVLATYLAASVIADTTFDNELRRMAGALAEEARAAPSVSEDAMPVLGALRHDSIGEFAAQVARGPLILGDKEIPEPPVSALLPGRVEFRDEILAGRRMRVAWLEGPGAEGVPPLLVQVAEPYERRRHMVGEVTWIVMVTVVLFVPITIGLVWAGLQRGLQPLATLRHEVEARPADDVSDLDRSGVPQEMVPFVDTLNRQIARVRRSSEAQRRFVADAAHQLRTPLAGIKTQAQAALRGGKVEDVGERLRRIEDGADHMSRLVTQLLALARADDALVQAPAMEPVDLNGMLREVCEQAAPAAIARQVSLGYEPAAGGARIAAAPVLLRELFANLVDNAIRYTPDGGEVAVRVGEAWPPTVVVEDSGLGIPPAEREMVFERFHRVLGTGRSGSGLGLAIVKAIADFHRATVTVAAGAAGQGTRFVVAFPDQGRT